MEKDSSQKKEYSEEYKSLVSEIYQENAIQWSKISNKKPNTQSYFLTKYDALMRMPTSGRQMFGSLYTCGVLQCTQKQYRDILLEEYAKDVAAGRVLAFTERSNNENGIRCYFEIDYRSFVRLPTEEEMMHHVEIAQKLVQDACGDTWAHAYVAKCTRKLKYANKDTKDTSPQLAMGLHIVFPHIVLETTQLRQLVLTLETRIATDNIFFSGCVDASSVKRECATLRPIFAYRLDQCKGCYPQRAAVAGGGKQGVTKKKKSRFAATQEEWCKEAYNPQQIDAYDSDSEPEAPPLMGDIECRSASCSKGYSYASPSVYLPWYILDTTGEVHLREALTELKDKEWILDMSIVPPHDLKTKFSDFKAPKDAPEPETCAIRSSCASGSIVFKAESQSMHAKGKTKTGVELSPQLHSNVYKILTSVVREFDPAHYSILLPHSVNYNRQTHMLTVSVRGDPGWKYCPLVQRSHGGNRIYFVIKLNSKQKHIQLQCYHPTCQSMIQAHKRQLRENNPKKKKHLAVTPSASTLATKPIEVIHISDAQKTILNNMCKSITPQLLRELRKAIGVRFSQGVTTCKISQAPTVVKKEKQSEAVVYDPRCGMYVPEQDLLQPFVNGKRNQDYYLQESNTKRVCPSFSSDTDTAFSNSAKLQLFLDQLSELEMAFPVGEVC